MSVQKPLSRLLRISLPAVVLIFSLSIPYELGKLVNLKSVRAEETCTAGFVPVGPPLNDLGGNDYVSIATGPTGFEGGLYPNGQNKRPPEHEVAGLSIANQIVPLNANGSYDPVNGKIALVSIGMSNTSQEFLTFMDQTEGDPEINPRLVLVNGAQGAQVAPDWADPDGDPWEKLASFLSDEGVTNKQVQVAWVKLAQFGADDFPQKAQSLQSDLEKVSRNLHTFFPNIKLAFFSSRTRSYLIFTGLSPEPTAFETGYSVKWLIEKQIEGDPTLNYDPQAGPVVAPFLSWGPYLWIDGLNERSDGLTWTQKDLKGDCTHPSEQGKLKVANQLETFFKFDSITAPWFLANPDDPPTPPPPIPYENSHFIPIILFNLR
jgi:hypothetical protein